MDKIAEVSNDPDTLWSRFYMASATPWLAAANSACFLASPFISTPATTTVNSQSWSINPKSLLFRSKTSVAGVTGRMALLFGAAEGLGSYMVYDGDAESGSGFCAAWGSLYLIMTGKGPLKALAHGKVWPLCVSLVTLGSTTCYGSRFITGKFQ